MIKFKPDHQPQWIDNSGLCAFSRCEAKYFFSRILHLTTPNPKPAMDYGTAAHIAIPLAQISTPDYDLVKAKAEFIRTWREFGHEDDAKRNPMNACKLIDHFASNPRPYDIIQPPQALSPDKRYSEYEFAFCMAISDDPDALDYAGRVDSVGRSKASGNIWGIEYKTSSELGSRLVGCFDLNSQIIGYSIILFLLFPDDKVDGCMVEALRVTSANPENLCIPVYVEDHVQEAFISYYNKQCKAIRRCYESGEWEQNFSACTTYNQHGLPGYQCDYMSLCKSADWRTMLESYKVEEWKPFLELKQSPDTEKETQDASHNS